ncbi:hypothetical protein D7Y21_16965 [Corallococcus sp. AB045]|nr:hypothetical protein D7Y21_16965 [Corallococcus sp. AB045]
MLPHDFPSWDTMYSCFRLWRDAGVAGVHSRSASHGNTSPPGTRCASQRRRVGQPDGADDGKRRAQGVRRWQEGEGQEATPVGR